MEKEIIINLLNEGESIKLSPKGKSMRPLIKSGRDFVYLKKAENYYKGDLVLYKIKSGELVLHRIYSVVEKGFLMLGDGNIQIEPPLDKENIYGKVIKIERKGHQFSVDNHLYKLYSKIWNNILPLRKIIFKIRHTLRNFFSPLNKNSRDLLTLCNFALKQSLIPDYFNPNWNKLLKAIYANRLETLLAEFIVKLPENLRPTKEQIQFLQNYTFKQMHHQLIVQNAIGDLLSQADNKNINVALLKGFVLADNYPQPYARCSDDVDIFTGEDYFNPFCDLLENNNYQIILSEEQGQTGTVEYSLGEKVIVEVHKHIAVRTTKEKYNKMIEFGLCNYETFIKKNVCDMTITTFDDTQHLFYLVYHTAKHFSHANAECRMLTDISLFINKNFNNIDFDKFHKCMKLIEYDKFCDALFYVCIKYFGMNEKSQCNKPNIIKKQAKKMLNSFINNMIVTDKGKMEKYALYFNKYSRLQKSKKSTSIRTKIAILANSHLIARQHNQAKKWKIN